MGACQDDDSSSLAADLFLETNSERLKPSSLEYFILFSVLDDTTMSVTEEERNEASHHIFRVLDSQDEHRPD